MPTGTISKVRQIIRAEELINKVQTEVLDKGKFKMSAAEVGAIKLLLNKVIPDLKGVEVKLDATADINHNHMMVEFFDPSEDSKEA